MPGSNGRLARGGWLQPNRGHFLELVPNNPAGVASQGRDQSAGYARRRYLSRDCGRGFNSRRLHLRKEFEPPSAPEGGSVKAERVDARDRSVERTSDVGRDGLQPDLAEDVAQRLRRAGSACSRTSWRWLSRSVIHSTGGGRKIFSRPSGGARGPFSVEDRVDRCVTPRAFEPQVLDEASLLAHAQAPAERGGRVIARVEHGAGAV
jgi:hypothetical protein